MHDHHRFGPDILTRVSFALAVAGWGSIGLLKVVPYLAASRSYHSELPWLFVGIGEIALAIAIATPSSRHLALWISTALAIGLIIYSFIAPGKNCNCFGPAVQGSELARRGVAALLLWSSAISIGCRRSIANIGGGA